MYIGSKLRPRLEGDSGAVFDEVQDKTVDSGSVDLFEHREDADWISAAQHCYRLSGIKY